jgi:hypothetical protein
MSIALAALLVTHEAPLYPKLTARVQQHVYRTMMLEVVEKLPFYILIARKHCDCQISTHYTNVKTMMLLLLRFSEAQHPLTVVSYVQTTIAYRC